jgi:hypothetical protein
MRKADCTPEQWEAYKATAKEWYHRNRDKVIERTKAYNKTDKAKERRRTYDMKPEVKARRQERERDSTYQKERYARMKADPDIMETRRVNHRTWRHGMDQERYDRLLAFQDRACAVCKTPFDGKRPCIDHCHDSGARRGLLCRHCNIIEGHIRAIGLSPHDLLGRLHDYLQNPPNLEMG